ncbi:MAG: AAA family ATPase [Anaerolineae bacterium]|nr:AAA family ATPase [Anaerolineae bacterium]MCB9131230.1 AAA family ATPase [Anaerolineales bacterium]MCB0233130.1 AAA family ATPase [Anaerolineae bacterium]MCB0237834.1 AAA family ATPase [Anaerolineae bacterium]MCB0241938.1 AAA family ATPase [Anaerolineae bacterium]
MNCPTCNAANPSGARFCNNCGTRLPTGCPNCGHVNQPGSKFCNNCGFKLDAAGAPAADVSPASPLDRYLPPELRAKLEAARSTRAGADERRIVTILFCDVKGSTAAASQLDPEEWAEIINGAFEHMIAPIYRYEGTVARLMGDGILAFFGAPIAHEDDPQRAALAGLEIVQGIADYCVLVQRRWGLPLEVRVGINTGLVLVGEVGSDMRTEYTALGDAINIAARMEQTAQPGTVQVAEDTWRLVAPLFEWQDLGTLDIKGKAEPLHTYRPLRQRARPGRVRGLESHGIGSPVVGRAREMAALRQALHALQDGRGGVISLIGEAGLGKSRMLAEVRESIAGERLRWREARSLSYSTAMPHFLSIEALRALIDAPPDADGETTGRALRAALGSAGSDHYPTLAHLLGVPLDEDETMMVRFLDGPALLARYVEACRALLVTLTEEMPVALVFDDLHWADPSSVELWLQVLLVAVEAPVLFLFASRPEREAAGWRLLDHARELPGLGALELHLSPLTEADSLQLVTNLLEIDALPEGTRTRILAKAEGNPFFVEEVIRMLIDEELIVRRDGNWTVAREIESLDIPDTLNGVLAARIDRLSDEARHVLQIAAVIGRQFYTRVLENVLTEEGLA